MPAKDPTAAKRKKRFQARRDRGEMVAPVEINGEHQKDMVRFGYLDDGPHDGPEGREIVGRAVREVFEIGLQALRDACKPQIHGYAFLESLKRTGKFNPKRG